MKNLNRNFIKILTITITFFSISCDFIMKRDNVLDPGSNNFVLPEVTANFSAGTTFGGVRLSVNFADQSTGNIDSWEWDFDNDGIIDSTEQNPSFTYELTGIYSVRLKVYESRGFTTDEIVKTDYIEVVIGSPIINLVKNDFNGATSVSSADIDQDGDNDIIGVSYYNGTIIWFENDNHSSFTEHTVVNGYLYLWSVIPADIDGDGDIDLISAGLSYGTYSINWWENHKGDDPAWKDNWTRHNINKEYNMATSVEAADMDNDGDLDIVESSFEDAFGSGLNSELNWWENEDRNPGEGDGNASSWIKHKLTENNTGVEFKGIKNLTVTDADNDNDYDIVYTEFSQGKIILLENRKGQETDWKDSFTEHTIDSNFETAEDIFSADIDGDGYRDIIGVSYGIWNSSLYKYENSSICWWKNKYNETGSLDSSSWQKQTIFDDFNGGRTVIAEDMDGDEDIDIIAGSSNNDTVIWCENTNNTGTEWANHVIDTHFHTAFSLHTADIDDDGDTDLLGASRGNYHSGDDYWYMSKIVWWEIIY